jgi:pre-rRNA-processing protein TSR4
LGHKTECQQLRTVSETSDSGPVNNGVAPTEKQKVASKSLWKEFVLINEDESEYDTEMSGDDEVAKPLVSKREVDDQMKSLMNDFEVNSSLVMAIFANFKRPQMILIFHACTGRC